MDFPFKHLALGGTFDLLHAGHRAFLEFAFSQASKVSVGITTGAMAKRIGKDPAQGLATRLKNLRQFLKEKNYLKRSKIILIKDIYGSTLIDKTLDGLVVTDQTLRGAYLINQKRRKLGLSPLIVLVCPKILADDGEIISTGRIRKGIIDRNGFSFYKFLSSKKKGFILPPNLRQKLRQPQGEIFSSVDELKQRLPKLGQEPLIVVGDESTRALIKRAVIPNLAIVDFKIARKNQFDKLTDLGFDSGQSFTIVRNQAGIIQRSLIAAILKFFQNKTNPFVIKVQGEEDLAVLPMMMAAPLNTLIVYGQRKQGLVLIKVTEQKKAAITQLLKQFR